MNLKQSIEQGVEIVEVVEVQAHMKFQMNEEPIEDTEDFQEALYLYDTSQAQKDIEAEQIRQQANEEALHETVGR